MISVLTGKHDARLLKILSAQEIAAEWKRSFSIDVGAEFREIERIEYLQCDATGFRWYSPPEAAGTSTLYEQLQKFDWYYMPKKWEFSIALQLLSKKRSIVEVGVGEGYFLEAAKREGLEAEGIEMNRSAADRARKRGLKVHEISGDGFSPDMSGRYDAVCSFQVLEHVSDPINFLKAMLNLVDPNGELIISVPNAAVMRKIDPRTTNLLDQPPHHMGHWEESTFRALEGLLPLKVKAVYREPLAPYHVSWMLNGYLRGIISFLGPTFCRLLVNNYTTFPLQLLLKAGLRKLLPGHTLLVVLEPRSN